MAKKYKGKTRDQWIKAYAKSGFYIAGDGHRDLVKGSTMRDMSLKSMGKLHKKLTKRHGKRYEPAFNRDQPFNWMDVKEKEKDKLDPRHVNWEKQYADAGLYIKGNKQAEAISGKEFERLQDKGSKALMERFGELTGQTRFSDIDKKNYSDVNWEQKFKDRGHLWEEYKGSWDDMDDKDKWEAYQLSKGEISDDWDDVAGKDRERELESKLDFREKYNIKDWLEESKAWKVDTYGEGKNREGKPITPIRPLDDQLLDIATDKSVADQARAATGDDLDKYIRQPGDVTAQFQQAEKDRAVNQATKGDYLTKGTTQFVGGPQTSTEWSKDENVGKVLEDKDLTPADIKKDWESELTTQQANLGITRTEGVQTGAEGRLGTLHTTSAVSDRVSDTTTPDRSADFLEPGLPTDGTSVTQANLDVPKYEGPSGTAMTIRNFKREKKLNTLGTGGFKHRTDALTIQ